MLESGSRQPGSITTKNITGCVVGANEEVVADGQEGRLGQRLGSVGHLFQQGH